MSTLTGTRTQSTSHSPPSLPSFAQAFSNINHAGASTSMANLAKISVARRGSDQGSDMDTLPPIHNVDQSPDPDRLRDSRKSKKRSLDHEDHVQHVARPSVEHEHDTTRTSSTVKREISRSPSPSVSQMELDQLDPSPSPPRRPIKKRRVGGGVQGSKSQPSGDRDSPGSPVIEAFTVPNSDQGALEQVRAMLSIKQKQKEIIEQRRGSAAGLLQSTPPPTSAVSPKPGVLVRRQSGTNTINTPAASSSQQRTSPQQQHAQPTSQHATQSHHFSPPQQALPPSNNSFLNSRRRRGTLQANGHGHVLPPESSHPLAQPPRLPPPVLTPTSSAFSQPPPPHVSQSSAQVQSQIARTPAIAKSTTTRAAPPKPLTIAPLAHSRRLEPLVHSAPVIGGFGPVRVPELPPIPITPGGRRISSGGLGGGGGGANVAIAKSGGMRTAGLGLGLSRLGAASTSGVGTVPPTPAYASLSSQQQQQLSVQDGKTGFLQMFENFYDSLADSRLLKQWLQEQLAKSNLLLEQLSKLEKEKESGGVTLAQVEELVERRVAPMRNEVEGLRRRVGELEEMLYRERQRGAARRESFTINPEFEDDLKSLSRRGPVRLSDASGYVFPERREESGDRDRDRERERERGSPAGSLHSSPSFDQRRLSTSAVRLESGPSQHSHVHPVFPLPQSSSQHRPSPLGLERERERERERDSARAWDRRRPAESSTIPHSNSTSNGRHDTDRERAPPPSTQGRAPSA